MPSKRITAPFHPAPGKPNTMTNGTLACANGVAFLDHYPPPFGTGAGCPACEVETTALLSRIDEAPPKKTRRTPKAAESPSDRTLF